MRQCTYTWEKMKGGWNSRKKKKKQNSQVLRVGSLIYKYTPKKEEGEDKRRRKSRGCRKYKKYFQGPIFRCEPTYSAITDWPTQHGINKGGKSVCRLFHHDIECLIWSMHARHNIIILKKEKEWREEVKGPHANDGRLCRRCACATAGEESLSSCAINSHPRGCSGCSPLTGCARGEGGGEISRDPLRGAAAPAAAWVVKVCLCTGWGIQIFFFFFSILYFGRLCFTVTSATSSSSCSLPPPSKKKKRSFKTKTKHAFHPRNRVGRERKRDEKNFKRKKKQKKKYVRTYIYIHTHSRWGGT